MSPSAGGSVSQPTTSPSSQIDCLGAQARVQRFASATLELREHSELRDHCQECADCMEHFERVAATLARLGHDRRITRVAKEKELRRLRLRSDVFEAGESKGWSRSRLRTLIYPAFFAVLMLLLTQRSLFDKGAQVQAHGPEVWLRGQVLDPALSDASMHVRERVFVGLGGKAEIRTGKTVWNLGEGCEVRFEATRPPSLRLFRGPLEVRGAFRCYTPIGIVIGESNAQASFRWNDQGVQVSVGEGALLLSTADGETTLLAGQSWPMASP